MSRNSRAVVGAIARLLGGWAVTFAILALALPLGLRGSAGATSLRFLVEFLTEGRHAWLSIGAPPAMREPFVLKTGDPADLWRPAGHGPWPGLVLVHGLTPQGKDDPRLVWTASLLAHGGFAVLVPDLPGMRAQRLRPDDADVVAAGIQELAADPRVAGPRLVVIAVSVGVAPALRAAARPAIGPHVRLVVSLGGYAEARDLIRYFTTGAFAFDDVAGQVRIDPALAPAFVGMNLDLIHDPAGRAAVQDWLDTGSLPADAGPEARAVVAVLANRDPGKVDTLLAALPAQTRHLLDVLSPARDVRRLSARLLLVHGRQDPAVPFTESLRLNAVADPRRTRLILVNLLSHVEGLAPSRRQQLGDLLRLWSVTYELFRD